MNTIYALNLPGQLDGLRRALAAAVLPPDDIDIDVWAERSIELSPAVTKAPGLIRLRPYQREPLRAVKATPRVTLVWAAQNGKTIVLQCVLGYIIDQTPGPTMVVYPDQALGKRRSKKHLQPLLTDSAALRVHLTGVKDDIQLYEWRLDRMNLSIGWSGSASQMAGEPIQYLLRDETAKFQGATDKEADSISLSERRTMSYPHSKRIFDCTTPTLEKAPGWSDLVEGTYEERYLPCPNCGQYQVLKFKQFRYPTDQGENEKWIRYLARAQAETYYECEFCKHHINNADKIAMDKLGQWRARNPEMLNNHRSFHLPSWYSYDVCFGEVVFRYLTQKDDVERYRDFLNSDCAEPYRDEAENQDENQVLKHRLDYPPNFVPTLEPCLLLMTVDIGKNHQWYAVRAHTRKVSYLVDYGSFVELAELEGLMDKTYPDSAGRDHPLYMTAIDSQYETAKIYEFVLSHRKIIPLKGNPNQGVTLKFHPQSTYPESQRKLPKRIGLLVINTDRLKEDLLTTMTYGFHPDTGDFDKTLGRWFLHEKTSDIYANHLTGEVVVEKLDKAGYPVRTWKKEHDNHLFDCETYQMALRQLFSNQLLELNYAAKPNVKMVDVTQEN